MQTGMSIESVDDAELQKCSGNEIVGTASFDNAAESANNTKVKTLAADEVTVTSEADVNLEPSTSKEANIEVNDGKLESKYSTQYGQPITRSKDKDFKCDTCGYSTFRKSNFKKHLKDHMGDRICVCEICNYETDHESKLRKHMRTTHAEVTPFACEFCSFKAPFKGTLDEHLKVHRREMPLTCEICDYKTTVKRALKKHQKTHAGEKLFQCNRCDFSGDRWWKLRKHVKTHIVE